MTRIETHRAGNVIRAHRKHHWLQLKHTSFKSISLTVSILNAGSTKCFLRLRRPRLLDFTSSTTSSSLSRHMSWELHKQSKKGKTQLCIIALISIFLFFLFVSVQQKPSPNATPSLSAHNCNFLGSKSQKSANDFSLRFSTLA